MTLSSILGAMPSWVTLPPQANSIGSLAGGAVALLGALFVLTRIARWCSTPLVIIREPPENESADEKEEISELRRAAIRRLLERLTVTLTEDDVSPARGPSINDCDGNEPADGGGMESTSTAYDDEEAPHDGPREAVESSLLLHDDAKGEAAVPENSDIEAGSNGPCQIVELSPLLAGESGDGLVCGEARRTVPTQTCQIAECAKATDDARATNGLNLDGECPICHEEYSPGDRICRSSHPQCPHIFHEECVLDWLVALGRTRSKHRRGRRGSSASASLSKVPKSWIAERRLLDYRLECPCCRRDFVDRPSVREAPRGEDGA